MSRFALLAVLALVLAGCGAEAADAPAGDAAATNTIDMPKSYRFEPADTTVASGTTVTWTNSDNFTHNVTIDDELVGQAEPGQTIEHTFAQPGTFDYICSLHPQDMRGTVTVTE